MKNSVLLAFMGATSTESVFTKPNLDDPIVQAKIESWSWENPKYKPKLEEPKSKFIPNKKIK